jgi:hypothetical protein
MLNSLSRITSIVTQLPPSIDGVGDYALNLAHQLRKDFNIQTRFVVGNPGWDGTAEIEGFQVRKIQNRSPEALLDALAEDFCAPVLLHYVGYGYAKRGCPSWLVQGLQQWKNLHPSCSLITMFHEVAAFGPPWTSSFWLSSLQQNLAGKLATTSNSCIVNKQQYGDWIEKLSGSRKIDITCLPVFSNMGEPELLLPLSERSRRLVIFGSRNSKLDIYDRYLPVIAKICKFLDINEIIDIGVPTGLNLTEISAVSIQEQGITEAAKVSQIMQDSIAGFLSFPPPSHLAKSGIFASYCAHGLIPCMVEHSMEPVDGLESDKHYWSDRSNLQLSLQTGQDIANCASNWYQAHSLSAQSNFLYTNYFNKVLAE